MSKSNSVSQSHVDSLYHRNKLIGNVGKCVDGEVVNCNYDDASVTISYTSAVFPSRKFEQTLDATVYENKISEFDKFLKINSIGECIVEEDILGEEIEILIGRNEKSDKFTLSLVYDKDSIDRAFDDMNKNEMSLKQEFEEEDGETEESDLLWQALFFDFIFICCVHFAIIIVSNVI